MTHAIFTGRVGIQQRVIPSYRAAFIDTLATACQGGLSVFAGEPLKKESIETVDRFNIAHYTPAKNTYMRDPGSAMFLCWQRGFLRWLENWQPDILIVEANPRYLVTRQAISWMHRKGRKVIGWGLGAPAIGGPLAGLRRWERSGFLHSLDAVIAYSQQGAEQYRVSGFPEQRVYVASNAAAAAPTNPAPQRTLEIEGKATVLFVGRLQSRKRVDLLLKGCAALPQALQPNVVIVGDGPARDELEELARQVYPNTEFTGAKHGAEAEPYFLRADLFVLPGTGGLAIQQAMAYALPVIVARGDGTQEDLVRRENGWMVQPDDLQSLTSALYDALSDPATFRKMGNASYRIVADEININKMAEVFVRVFNDLA